MSLKTQWNPLTDPQSVCYAQVLPWLFFFFLLLLPSGVKERQGTIAYAWFTFWQRLYVMTLKIQQPNETWCSVSFSFSNGVAYKRLHGSYSSWSHMNDFLGPFYVSIHSFISLFSHPLKHVRHPFAQTLTNLPTGMLEETLKSPCRHYKKSTQKLDIIRVKDWTKDRPWSCETFAMM